MELLYNKIKIKSSIFKKYLAIQNKDFVYVNKRIPKNRDSFEVVFLWIRLLYHKIKKLQYRLQKML